jgi:hypothetical protein
MQETHYITMEHPNGQVIKPWKPIHDYKQAEKAFKAAEPEPSTFIVWRALTHAHTLPAFAVRMPASWREVDRKEGIEVFP